MKIFAETERLILREIEYTDESDLFEMDADPEVHLYIENKPVKSTEEIRAVIGMLRKQYRENGIGRWAVVDKQTRECVGWAGLKYVSGIVNKHSDFYDLGYRFKKKHWGRGYATESSAAALAYGFNKLKPDSVFSMADPRNINSKNVLAKLGFEFKETFDDEGDPVDWFELRKENYKSGSFVWLR